MLSMRVTPRSLYIDKIKTNTNTFQLCQRNATNVCDIVNSRGRDVYSAKVITYDTTVFYVDNIHVHVSVLQQVNYYYKTKLQSVKYSTMVLTVCLQPAGSINACPFVVRLCDRCLFHMGWLSLTSKTLMTLHFTDS